jgi:hypothetical protein
VIRTVQLVVLLVLAYLRPLGLQQQALRELVRAQVLAQEQVLVLQQRQKV